MSWKTTIACLIAVPGLVLALGYWFKPEPVTVVVLTPEQEAIQRYSEGTQKASVSLDAFVEAWNRTSLIKDAAEKQTVLETDVLISLRSYVSALEDVPTDTPELTRIHGILLSAYEDNLRHFEQYAEDHKRAPSPDHLKSLIQKLAELKDKEKEYQKELRQYYQTHQANPTDGSLSLRTLPKGETWAGIALQSDEVDGSWFI